MSPKRGSRLTVTACIFCSYTLQAPGKAHDLKWWTGLLYLATFATTCLKAPWCTQMNSAGGGKNPITLFSLILEPVSFALMTGELDVGQTTGNTVNSRYMKESLSDVIAPPLPPASGCTCRHQSTCWWCRSWKKSLGAVHKNEVETPAFPEVSLALLQTIAGKWCHTGEQSHSQIRKQIQVNAT